MLLPRCYQVRGKLGCLRQARQPAAGRRNVELWTLDRVPLRMIDGTEDRRL